MSISCPARASSFAGQGSHRVILRHHQGQTHRPAALATRTAAARGSRGRTATWCSAALTAPGWTAGRCAASSRPSRRRPGWGEDWTPRELRHSFVSILSASDLPLADISLLVGRVSTSVTETLYRQEIRPALTRARRPWTRTSRRSPGPRSGPLGGWLPAGSPKIKRSPGMVPGTPSDLQVMVGTAGFEPATL
jgi:hypothetical protein